MSAYTIHLAKAGSVRVNQTGVERDLQAWFGRVLRAARRRRPRFDSVAFNWIDGEQEINVPDREILVYLLSSRRRTLLPRFGSTHEPDADHNGITLTENNLTLSEVYCDCHSARFIAETIFHEAMHNKTGWSDRRLHRRGGIAGGDTTSINGVEIAEGQEQYYRSRFGSSQPTQPELRRLMCRGKVYETHDDDVELVSNRNVRDMARYLHTRRPQWGLGLVPAQAVELNLDNL
ncbi:MAG: hypothetical protein ACR2P1_28840 [Pseudomonadales bacterium]